MNVQLPLVIFSNMPEVPSVLEIVAEEMALPPSVSVRPLAPEIAPPMIKLFEPASHAWLAPTVTPQLIAIFWFDELKSSPLVFNVSVLPEPMMTGPFRLLVKTSPPKLKFAPSVKLLALPALRLASKKPMSFAPGTMLFVQSAAKFSVVVSALVKVAAGAVIAAQRLANIMSERRTEKPLKFLPQPAFAFRRKREEGVIRSPTERCRCTAQYMFFKKLIIGLG